MDGENNGSNPINMDDLGVALFLETPIWARIPRRWVVSWLGVDAAMKVFLG